MSSVIERLEELVIQSDYLQTSAYAIIGMLVVVLIVHLATRRLRFFKYIPGIAAVVLGTSYILGNYNEFYEVENIDRLMYNFIVIGAGIIGIFFALILGIIAKETKPNIFKRMRARRKEKQEKEKKLKDKNKKAIEEKQL